jgi:proteasome accessory factor B
MYYPVYITYLQGIIMIKTNSVNAVPDSPDNDFCLEWLKNQRYPDGIICPICDKVTKHHKLSNFRCYACDNCGNRVYPTAGTIFHKSTTPLSTWFKVIDRIANSGNNVPVKTIQREYGMTYKTAWRMVHRISEYLKENKNMFPVEDLSGKNLQKRDRKEAAPDFNKTTHDIKKSLFTGNPVTTDSYTEDHPKDSFRKQDRIARLLKLLILLWQNPQGLTVEELSKNGITSKRTVYRDLQAIESELNIPIWEEGNKRGIVEGNFLPPIAFNLEEAFNVFIASRLLQKQFRIHNPSLNSTLTKISALIPPHLRNQIKNSMEYVKTQPLETYKIKNLKLIVQAWQSQRQVKIRYQEEFSSEITEFIIEPYFMEPILSLHSIIVIAYCPSRKIIYPYNIDHIVGEVTICADTYEMPQDYNAVDSINSAWGLPVDNEIVTVKLHFKPNLSKTIMSTIWHPSQIVELQDDGSLIATFEVRKMSGFRSWVLNWGDEVEVLEPQAFRDKLAEFGTALLKTYST